MLKNSVLWYVGVENFVLTIVKERDMGKFNFTVLDIWAHNFASKPDQVWPRNNWTYCFLFLITKVGFHLKCM